MDEQEIFLSAGNQTKISDEVRGIIPQLPKAINLGDVFLLLSFLHKTIKFNEKEKSILFRKRTADEIIKSGFATGCTDYALAFLPMLRKNGIPARYAEAIKNRWFLSADLEQLEGHVFVEVFLNNQWYIIDPQEATINLRYNRHKIIKRGLDSWDLGITDLASLREKFLEYNNSISKK